MEAYPSLFAIQPFDATKGSSVYFTYMGSKQSVANELVISNSDTGEIVYDYEYNTFEKSQPIPPNQIQNGIVYNAKIRVKHSDGTYSAYSTELQFKTFTTPVLDITSIDGLGHVYNQDVLFIADYTQSDGENVSTFQFKLYDQNESLIETYPVRTPSQQNEISEEITGLVKGNCYFVECSIVTVNSFAWSQREKFIAMYIVPSVNAVVFVESDDDNGFININTNLKQITGTQVKGTAKDIGIIGYDSDNYEYNDDEWVVIPSDRPMLFSGLGMNKASDFVLKMWCKDIPSDTMFAQLSTGDGSEPPISLYKYDDKIVAEKNFNGKLARYRSNQLTVPQGTAFMVYLKSVDHRIDLSLKLV